MQSASSIIFLFQINIPSDLCISDLSAQVYSKEEQAWESEINVYKTGSV